MADNVQDRIEQIVKGDSVVLFMKGTRNAPQCGFSATVVSILDQYLPEYRTVNVLADQEVREGVKEYASWPTIPQLYVAGEFLGGCDIIRQMDEQGELMPALGDSVQMPSAPNLKVSDAAVEVFKQAMAEAEGDDALRIAIDAAFRHDLALDTPRPSDITLELSGLRFIFDAGSARRAQGLEIDYVTAPEAGFKMDNPNAPPSVQQISAKEAKALIDEHAEAKFIDVRTPGERDAASIEGTELLTADNIDSFAALPKDTPLVFFCHHGQRSYAAAINFLEQGFTKVYNVVGGIEAWSRDVDPSIPRY